jgi:hypothetical protein
LALGRLKTGEMNKTEAAYDSHLWDMRRTGEVLWYKFEGIKLRLADNTFYTPDFAVLLADRALEMHETKGFWEDDARVKIKVAASLYPFRFKALKPRAKKNGGGWTWRSFDEPSEDAHPYRRLHARHRASARGWPRRVSDAAFSPLVDRLAAG